MFVAAFVIAKRWREVKAKVFPNTGNVNYEKANGSVCVKSANFQEIQHHPSQVFLKKLLKIPQCVLMTRNKFLDGDHY